MIRISISLWLQAAALVGGAFVQTAADAAAAPARPQGPCDIYAAAGTPCVTAHSTVRALLAAYAGPLYQVQRQSDGKLLDIGVVPATGKDSGGYARADAQDRFCVDTTCFITRIYDQSGKGNHLHQAPPGPLYPGPDKGAFDALPIADMAPITIAGGHKAYGVYIMPGMGFRNNNARDLPINDEAAGIHAVVDGQHYSNGCCFNYGNASTNGLAVGTGTMESVYFGTSTSWGSGSGNGPWIMSDMEAGLFSGYNARVNEANPSITWRFVTGMFGGGGRNFWELRGGNAQEGGVKTFYAGVRPGSNENSAYFPMHKKGAIQMGNGGDNGNGSAGTFYEGAMTSGHPADAAFHAVQANIVAARYDVERIALSRLASFTPGAVKEVTARFTNTTGAAISGLRLSLALPAGWSTRADGAANFGSVAPGQSVQARFHVISPRRLSAGFLTARATWSGGADTTQQRVRSAPPVKINEVRFATGGNATDQFVELYNASQEPVDISGWSLVNTQTFFASVPLASIPAGTKLAAGSHYLLGLASSGLAAPAPAGATVVNVRSIGGFTAGQPVTIGEQRHTVKAVGTAATAPTTVFIPVSTGPWLELPAGSTHVPVANAAGFVVGERMGIDAGGHHEIVTVTAAGKAATQTTLSAATNAGERIIRVANAGNITVGDTLTVGTGSRMDLVQVAGVGAAAGDGTPVTLAEPLKFGNMQGVDVAGPGTGITFSPATRYAHRSGDAVQALGSGITLDRPLSRAQGYLTPVINALVKSDGYQGPAPHQWFGGNLSIRGGSIALTDPGSKVLVDAIVYGSQQSNSSASGAITTPVIATQEGVQHQGGCIAVIPGAGSGPSAAATALAASAPNAPDRSIGRFPDGADSDSLCQDFRVQPATTLPQGAAAGLTNIKVASVAGFAIGQSISVGAPGAQEAVTIAAIGTPGASMATSAADAGTTLIVVASAAGFSAGQVITVDSGAAAQSASIAAIQGGRGSARITLAQPLGRAIAAGAAVAGTGITLTAPLVRNHAASVPVTAHAPTPGSANRY